MKTIAQIIHQKTFPLDFEDQYGNSSYHEDEDGNWINHTLTSTGKRVLVGMSLNGFEDRS